MVVLLLLGISRFAAKSNWKRGKNEFAINLIKYAYYNKICYPISQLTVTLKVKARGGGKTLQV